jgi:hypothetical protein
MACADVLAEQKLADLINELQTLKDKGGLLG